jgi:cysteine-rich repeat protein
MPSHDVTGVLRGAARVAGSLALVLAFMAPPALGLEQSRFAGTVATGCTFLGCSDATGSSNNGCAAASSLGAVIPLTGYGFSIPANATITGVVVEPKGSREGLEPTVRLLKGGALAGSAQVASLLQDPPPALCADTLSVPVGGTNDLWNDTWSPAEVNAGDFGVRVASGSAMLLDAVRITVHFTIDTALCGDGFATHDEECDDGNTARGDGCSPACQTESLLTAADDACINVINKDATRVGAAQAKVALDCLKRAQRGQDPDAQACLTSDPRGTVAKAVGKIEADFASRCEPPPAYGTTAPAKAGGGAMAAAQFMIEDVFGPDLGAAAIALSSDKTGATCQASVLQALQKVVDARTKVFLACKKTRLANDADPVLSAWDIGGCLDDVASDDRGSIAKAAASLASTVTSKCAGVTLSSAFPGACAGAGAGFAGCLDARAACRVCQLLDEVDRFGRDCDLFDDGADNDSCP